MHYIQYDWICLLESQCYLQFYNFNCNSNTVCFEYTTEAGGNSKPLNTKRRKNGKNIGFILPQQSEQKNLIGYAMGDLGWLMTFAVMGSFLTPIIQRLPAYQREQLLPCT